MMTVRMTRTYRTYDYRTQTTAVAAHPEAQVASLDAALIFARQYESGAQLINGQIYRGNPAAPLFACNDAVIIGTISED